MTSYSKAQVTREEMENYRMSRELLGLKQRHEPKVEVPGIEEDDDDREFLEERRAAAQRREYLLNEQLRANRAAGRESFTGMRAWVPTDKVETVSVSKQAEPLELPWWHESPAEKLARVQILREIDDSIDWEALRDSVVYDKPPVFALVPKKPDHVERICRCGQTIWNGMTSHCGDCMMKRDQSPLDERIAAAQPEPDDRHECAWSTPSSDGEGWR
jgi:hypothetical protein